MVALSCVSESSLEDPTWVWLLVLCSFDCPPLLISVPEDQQGQQFSRLLETALVSCSPHKSPLVPFLELVLLILTFTVLETISS